MTATVACSACGTRNRVPATASGTPRCAKCKAPLAWIVEAGEGDFDELVQAKIPVLVDFWAPWCGPCRVVSPAVEHAAVELAGRLKVLKINVDDAPLLASRYDIQGIPTLLLFRSGQPAARQVGALPGHALLGWLRSELTGPTA